MAAAENDNSVMDITYDDMPGLMSSSGVFSFCVYTRPGAFDEDLDGPYRLSIDRGKSAHVYFVGLLSYVEMIRLHPEIWGGWKAVIHTDRGTYDGNPKAFGILKSKGAIIGFTTLLGRYSDVGKFRGIFRNNRYYPLFIAGLNVPILIRDADTIFEGELVKDVVDKFYEKITTVKNKNGIETLVISNANIKKIPIEEIADIQVPFIEKLSRWEHFFVEKISTFRDKVIFTYDDSYSLPLTNENIINKNSPESMLWTGIPENRPKSKPEPGKYKPRNYLAKKVRFLAGNVSKIGEALPATLWTRDFPSFLRKYITNANLTNDYLYRKVTISDEVFLTEVIYKWAKRNRKAEFYKMNYVSTIRINSIFEKYVEHKYPKNSNAIELQEKTYEVPINNNQNKNVTAGTPPPTPVAPIWSASRPTRTVKYTIKNVKKDKLDENNQKLYNIIHYKGIENKSQELRRLADKLALENPEAMMNKNFFFNPFTNDLSKKPDRFPRYFFGGRRTYKKRKTHKNRK